MSQSDRVLLTAALCAAVITALDSVVHRQEQHRQARHAIKIFVASFACITIVMYCMQTASSSTELSIAAMSNIHTGDPDF